MISREELRSIPVIHKQIQREQEQLLFLREKATSLPSTLPDHERVQTSPSSNVNRYTEEAVDLNREIQTRLEELTELQIRASVFIDTVEDPLTKKILKYRYLKCYTWNEVSELLGYDARWIQQLEYSATSRLSL